MRVLVCIALVAGILIGHYGRGGPERTVLVGAGCWGRSDVAVAHEEDELPLCARIERHALR